MAMYLLIIVNIKQRISPMFVNTNDNLFIDGKEAENA